MKPTYRIKDWSTHFENNRTRDLKELRFVILPNKQDGDGYTELLDHPNGAAHYAAWVGLVQVSSKGKHPAEGCDNPAGCCECRGSLLRSNARPHDPASLSRLTRMPAVIFQEALPRLVEIGWIEVTTSKRQQNQADRTFPQGGAGLREISAPLARARGTEQNRTEGNGIEQKVVVVGSKFSESEWKEYYASQPNLNNRGGFLRSAATGRHDEAMIEWKERNNGIDATSKPGRNQTAVSRRDEDFRRKRALVKKLQSEGSGTTDKDVRGESS